MSTNYALGGGTGSNWDSKITSNCGGLQYYDQNSGQTQWGWGLAAPRSPLKTHLAGPTSPLT